jgi:hypothetical protein
MTTRSRHIVIALTIAAASLVAIWLSKLALATGLGTLLGFVSLPKATGRENRSANLLYAVAALASSVALIRFVLFDAMPSLVAAGNQTTAERAVSRLREILFAEDVMRRRALWDPDHDGIGSAALLGELSAKIPLRGGELLTPPLLNEAYAHVEDTRIGPAVLAMGYLFVVCLPRKGGGLSARPDDPVDDELAERRFVAYAWPAASQHGPSEAFFIDEHERILVSENRAGNEPRWAGPNFPPSCDAALDPATGPSFSPWRGKKPRTILPGER